MNTWFISDNHWYHSNILNFTDSNGNLIRPGFSDVHEMNAFMIERWNSVVKKNDKVYHLGDIIMRGSAWAFEEIIPQLNGEIVLIKGNHDKAKLNVYARYFKDVRSEIHMKTYEGDMALFTHRPIRLTGSELEFRGYEVFNIHGHIHQNTIDDDKYINVSVEVIDYTPISWNEINKRITKTKKERSNEMGRIEEVVY